MKTEFGETNKTVHPDDFMYNVLRAEHQAEYFLQAEETVHSIALIAQTLGSLLDCPQVLDFGAGYGRITRYLVDTWGSENVTICDIVPRAVAFCENTFGVKGFVVGRNLQDSECSQEFDIIFAGSVFTHLPPSKWQEVLDWFHEHLAPQGLIIFTVAGPRVAELVANGDRDKMSELEAKTFMAAYEYTGFAYTNYPNATEQGFEHGKSLASPRWVSSFLERHTKLRLRMYTERGWWRRQDVYVVSK